MALSQIQQKVILNATLNLDANAQKKIERAFGQDFFSKMLDAAEKGGSIFEDKMSQAADDLYATTRAMDNLLGKSSVLFEKAEQKIEEAEAKRTEASRELNAAAKATLEREAVLLERDARAHKRQAQMEIALNRNAIKTLQETYAVHSNIVRQYQVMNEGAAEVRQQQLDQEEAYLKHLGKTSAMGAGGVAASMGAEALTKIEGVVTSPSLESLVELMTSTLTGAVDAVEHATRDSENGIVKAVNQAAQKIAKGLRDVKEGVGKMGDMGTILNRLVNIVMGVVLRRKELAKGFVEGTPGAMLKNIGSVQAGLDQVRGIAHSLGITFDEAASMVGEALAANAKVGDIGKAAKIAKSLGLGIGEIVEQSVKLKSNFGTTADIFAETQGLAEATGLSLSASYGILQSVISGVQLMNSNLQSSIGWIKQLVQTFGEELGQQLAQSLGIFRGMSVADAIKEVLLMGEANARELVRDSMRDINRSTPQGRAAAELLGRGVEGSLEDLAVAIRHLSARGELKGTMKRGAALGLGGVSPTEMTGMQLLARDVGLGLGGAEEEVRTAALYKAGPVAFREFSGGVEDFSGVVSNFNVSVRTFDEAVQRLVDEAVTLGSAPDLSGVGQAIKDAFWALVLDMDPVKAADIIGKLGQPVNDFIYRGDSLGGVITPINKRDEFLGMKPGGPVEGALKDMKGPAVAYAGATPRPTNVTVNINGGDLGKVYEVVKTVLRQSGLRPPAGAYAT